MGTTFSVTVVEPPDSLDEDTLEADIVAALTRIDKLASTWREDSELSVFNADNTVDWIVVSPELCDALASSFAISAQTDGAFDVTVGPVVNLWGFGPDGQATEPPSADAIAAAMRSVGYEKIEADCAEGLVRKDDVDMYVDLSGWAKGHAVDEVAAVLEENGITSYLVEIGGEIRVRGLNAKGENWAVGIEAPSTTSRGVQAVVRVTNTAVATSGDYRNYFESEGVRYSHTIDPRTGSPVTHALASVTVAHESAAYADAIATALLVLGPEQGPSLAHELGLAAGFLVRTDASVEMLATPEFEKLDIE